LALRLLNRRAPYPWRVPRSVAEGPSEVEEEADANCNKDCGRKPKFRNKKKKNTTKKRKEKLL
jgi:hypothetical protein